MELAIEIGVGLVVIPWVAWVTSSIFSQRQELAVLKEGTAINQKLYSLLEKRLR